MTSVDPGVGPGGRAAALLLRAPGAVRVDLPLSQVVSEEYLRARSVFLWLADPEAVSLFQIDLRND